MPALGDIVALSEIQDGHLYLDSQDIALFACGIVARCAMYSAHEGVGKDRGIEPRGLFSIAVVPQANRVPGGAGHVTSP